MNYLQLKCTCFNIVHLWKLPWPWNPSECHWRSLEMTSLDRSYVTSYLCSAVTIALSCTVFDILDQEKCCDLEIRVRGHWRSLKLVLLFYRIVSLKVDIVAACVQATWLRLGHEHTLNMTGGKEHVATVIWAFFQPTTFSCSESPVTCHRCSHVCC